MKKIDQKLILGLIGKVHQINLYIIDEKDEVVRSELIQERNEYYADFERLTGHHLDAYLAHHRVFAYGLDTVSDLRLGSHIGTSQATREATTKRETGIRRLRSLFDTKGR